MRAELRFLPLVLRQIRRRPGRSALTILGVATAMFLWCAVRALEAGVAAATVASADDAVLVVYRENRFCPFTSRLPQSYRRRVEAVPGVASAVPMRIHVSNCRASLDVVVFRGLPEQDLETTLGEAAAIDPAQAAAWRGRRDAALVGESLAVRRGLVAGDVLVSGGIATRVVGVIRSDDPQHRNVAYVHLPFIQEASERGGSGGVVTQYRVVAEDPAQLEEVAAAIDAEFAHDPDPTRTRAEKAFVADAARDLVEIAGFAGWLGVAALVATWALVANAIVLAVAARVREFAVLRTLGFPPLRIGALVVAEGTLLGLVGGAVGAAAAGLVIRFTRTGLTTEGLSVELSAGLGVVLGGLALSALLGGAAGLVPAWRAARRPIVEGFRAI